MQRTTICLAALMVAAPLAGCVGDRDPASGPPETAGPGVILQGRDSFVENETTIVARNQTQWETGLERVWDTHHDASQPMPRAPPVNFSDTMAVAYFAGEIPGACAGVQVGNLTAPNGTSVEDDEAAWTLDVTLFAVENGTTQCSRSSPMQMVLLPPVAGDVTVETRRVTVDEAPEGWAGAFDRGEEERASESGTSAERSSNGTSANESAS